MRLPDCEFRLIAGRVIVSCSHPDTPEAVTIDDCASCQLVANPTGRKAHRCQHSQGQVSRQEQVECCGGKLNIVEIYTCDVHQECAGDKTSWNRLRANSIRVKACHNCCDFTVLPTS